MANAVGVVRWQLRRIMNDQPIFDFDNSYAKLSDKFFSRQAPTPVSAPSLIKFNDELAKTLKLDAEALQSDAGLLVFAGNAIPAGADPIAAVYAGHQFGGWSPQLGDGRAVLLGEVLGDNNERYDIQLKGSGPTPYSRQGDGRSAIGPVIREYVISEAMAALGVPTTRALCAMATGDLVRRETMLPGAVLTRVAQSHVRVGSFQYFAAKRDQEALQQLTSYIINRNYPTLASSENPPLALLKAVVEKQTALIAHWQSIGFIHGVMNTDNASVFGLTIDYGPCAFMDVYNPDTVFSSIDHQARYAYQNQPGIAQWNMANFAQCLLPLIDNDDEQSLVIAQAVIDSFPAQFAKAYLTRFRHKLGLSTEQADDIKLVSGFLDCLADENVDFTNAFRSLLMCSLDGAAGTNKAEALQSLFSKTEKIDAWIEQWRDRHSNETTSIENRTELMRRNNPAYIPRNHIVQQVITAAEQKNYEPMHELVSVLNDPYSKQAGAERFALPPEADEVVKATFCGT